MGGIYPGQVEKTKFQYVFPLDSYGKAIIIEKMFWVKGGGLVVHVHIEQHQCWNTSIG